MAKIWLKYGFFCHFIFNSLNTLYIIADLLYYLSKKGYEVTTLDTTLKKSRNPFYATKSTI